MVCCKIGEALITAKSGPSTPVERKAAAVVPKSPWRKIHLQPGAYLEPISRAAQDDGRLYTHRLFSAALELPGDGSTD